MLTNTGIHIGTSSPSQSLLLTQPYMYITITHHTRPRLLYILLLNCNYVRIYVQSVCCKKPCSICFMLEALLPETGKKNLKRITRDVKKLGI